MENGNGKVRDMSCTVYMNTGYLGNEWCHHIQHQGKGEQCYRHRTCSKQRAQLFDPGWMTYGYERLNTYANHIPEIYFKNLFH